MEGQFNVSENLLSLNGYSKNMDDCNFYRLFENCESLININHLLFPDSLSKNCYKEMFSGCSSLTTPPLLPAIELAPSCYSYMFKECVSLTTPPLLSAMTLANNCYEGMFSGCSSLATPPLLPAIELAPSCYKKMFASIFDEND
jgi:hypothetical protein